MKDLNVIKYKVTVWVSCTHFMVQEGTVLVIGGKMTGSRGEKRSYTVMTVLPIQAALGPHC